MSNGWGQTKPTRREPQPAPVATPYDPFKAPDGTREQKTAFATALLKSPSGTGYEAAQRAAVKVFGNERVTFVDQVARTWPRDPETVEIMSALVKEFGAEAFLPTKADVAREIYDRASTAFTRGEAFAGFKLYAELMGFVVRPAAVINNNTANVTHNVMVVKDHGTDDDWETKAKAQQKRVIDATRA